MSRETRKYSIYLLRCPVDNEIKYVGRSADLPVRYKSHIQSPTKACGAWIRGLLKQGKYPIMDELEKGLSYKESFVREREWALSIQKEHGTLLNQKYIAQVTPHVLLINYLKDPA